MGIAGQPAGTRRVRRRVPMGPVRVLVSLVVLVALADGCSHSPLKSSVGVNRSVFHLKPGDCVVPPTQIKAELTTVKVVSCREPHTQEVYALVADPGGDNYPGSTKLERFANGSCLEHYAGYVGIPYQDSSLFYTYLLPSVRSWAANDRTIVCVITTTGQKLTGSVKGTKR